MKIYNTGLLLLVIVTLIGSIILSNCEKAPTRTPIEPLINDTSSIEAVTAPNFALKGIDGKIVKLEDYKDKIVMIIFWETGSSQCRRILPDIVKLHKEYKEKDFEVIGIITERPESGVLNTVKKMKEAYGIEFPLAWYDNRVINDYGPIEKVPRTFILNKKRIIAVDIEGATSYSVFEKNLLGLLDNNFLD